MGKKSELVKKAKSYLGANYVHFCNAFWGGCYSWCASFVSVVARESGNGDIIPWNTSCTAQISWFRAHGCYLGKTTDIRVGDCIYYEFENPNDGADHVGIVVEVNGNMLTVIEGNKGSLPNNQTKVEYRYIPKSYSCIDCVCRPKYDDEVYISEKEECKEDVIVNIEIRQLSKGMKGKDVEAMQAILIAKGYSCGQFGSDGDFGEKTDSAVRNFQKEHKLEVDGICGQKTWKELISR